jgi:hypothetical protein
MIKISQSIKGQEDSNWSNKSLFHIKIPQLAIFLEVTCGMNKDHQGMTHVRILETDNDVM